MLPKSNKINGRIMLSLAFYFIHIVSYILHKYM